MKLSDIFLQTGEIKQGDWVKCSDCKGIFISKKNNRECIIATYNDKKKVYVTVNLSEIKEIERVNDTNLFIFAKKKHLMWINNRRTK